MGDKHDPDNRDEKHRVVHQVQQSGSIPVDDSSRGAMLRAKARAKLTPELRARLAKEDLK